MKRLLLCAAAVLAVAVLVATQASSQDVGPRSFMRAKLDHTQKLIEALATEDYDTMTKNAQALSLLSLAASWQVLQTPEYAQQSVEFRRAADSLTEAAKNKDLDAAALAYVDVTLKCVKCHKYVRGARMASTEPSVEPLPLRF